LAYFFLRKKKRERKGMMKLDERSEESQIKHFDFFFHFIFFFIGKSMIMKEKKK
jgi:hypothetical protein